MYAIRSYYVQLRGELFAVDILIESVEVAVGRLVGIEADSGLVDGDRHRGILTVSVRPLPPDEKDGADESGDDRPEDHLDDDRFLLV